MAIRNNVRLSEIEIVLMLEGLELVKKKAINMDDRFKAAYVDEVRDHLTNVIRKIDVTKEKIHNELQG